MRRLAAIAALTALFTFLSITMLFVLGAWADGLRDPCTGHGVKCCRQIARGDVPTKSCVLWADRFAPLFPRCCETHPTPCPSPTASTPCDVQPWGCWPTPEPSCAGPTPLPTPESHAKSICCTEAQAIHKAAVRALVARYNADRHALVELRKADMLVCKHGYVEEE